MTSVKTGAVIVLAGIALAVALGTVFSRVYPGVGVSTELALLFAVVGLAVAAGAWGLWRWIKGSGS